MKIDFFLTGRKGLAVLTWVCASRYRQYIGHVVAARDTAVLEDCVDNIQELCRSNDIPFFERNDYRASPAAAYRILVGWKWLVEPAGTIVLHDSLLPAYRGFAPLVNALINGEREIGATALHAAAAYDKGPVIARKKIPVSHPMRISDAIDAMADLYVGLIAGILEEMEAGRDLPAAVQDEAAATYSLWRDEADYYIDWEEDSSRILRTIYALSFPFQGACTLLNNTKIIIEDAVLSADVHIVNRQAGKVIFMENGLPVIVCGKGLLKITSAYYYSDKKPVLPLDKFRSRFGS